jgi:hypothetical protein
MSELNRIRELAGLKPTLKYFGAPSVGIITEGLEYVPTFSEDIEKPAQVVTCNQDNPAAARDACAMEEDVDEKVEEDLNNGYDDVKVSDGNDFFPNGADSPVVSATGPSGARHGDNPEQKKMQVAEVHKELVYSYRKYLNESKE